LRFEESCCAPWNDRVISQNADPGIAIERAGQSGYVCQAAGCLLPKVHGQIAD
jgi:hypothetical protein